MMGWASYLPVGTRILHRLALLVVLKIIVFDNFVPRHSPRVPLSMVQRGGVQHKQVRANIGRRRLKPAYLHAIRVTDAATSPTVIAHESVETGYSRDDSVLQQAPPLTHYQQDRPVLFWHLAGQCFQCRRN